MSPETGPDRSPVARATSPDLPGLPALVGGVVVHHRRGQVQHSFQTRVYQWLLDLDEIPRQPWYLRPFARFDATDHLGDAHRSIRSNVEQFVEQNGVSLGPDSRILMLANARVLGHVFDPLSVYWCLTREGRLAAVVAEVHNTYGERHAYLLHPDEHGRANTDKSFYVSPFYDVSGSYELQFTLQPDRVAVSVALHREGTRVFSAAFTGRPVPASRAALVRHLVRYPLMPQRVSALIRLHGIRLWLRHLPLQPRPPHDPQEGV